MHRVLSLLFVLGLSLVGGTGELRAQSDIDPAQLLLHIDTTRGRITVVLYPEEAPRNVANFVNLATKGFYNGMPFYRAVANGFIESGDPARLGKKPLGYLLADEFSSKLLHRKPGVLSLISPRPNENTSAFLISRKDLPWLDKRNTIIGRVLSGQDVVDTIQRGDKIQSMSTTGDVKRALAPAGEDLEKWNKHLHRSGKTSK